MTVSLTTMGMPPSTGIAPGDVRLGVRFFVTRAFRKRLAGTFEGDGSLGLLDDALDPPSQRVVQALQREQRPAVVHKDDDNVLRVLDGFFRGCGRPFLGACQGESFFVGELRQRAPWH